MIMIKLWNLLWEFIFKGDEIGADKKDDPFLLLVVVYAGNEPSRRKLFPPVNPLSSTV